MPTLPRRISADDPRVAAYRAVSDPALARSSGQFVAEGRLVVGRVLADPRFSVQSVLLNDAAYRELRPLVEASASTPELLLCNTSDFLGITGVNIHRGCLALVKRPPARSLHDVIAGAQRVVVLDAVSNPDNVGAIFRNGAAFGVDAIVAGRGCCDPFYRKAIRTSMGGVLRVPFAHADDWPRLMRALRSEGLMSVALTPRPPAERLDEFAMRTAGQRLALIAGAEGAGLTPSVESSADVRLRIPIGEEVDSLNVGVAVGIALYALRSVPLRREGTG
jgi:tRNA G18 (ribose-2'-O)-methylase SpoU